MVGPVHQYFFSSSIHYYVSGRFAAVAALNPTAGNLLHHAVEMALKGALSKKGVSADELKDLKHNLPRIWSRIKAAFPSSNLEEFDREINSIHAYESIRYPDAIEERGLVSTVGFSNEKPTIKSKHVGKTPRYQLRIKEIDELMKRVFLISGVNPKFFTSGLRQQAIHYLLYENDQAFWYPAWNADQAMKSSIKIFAVLAVVGLMALCLWYGGFNVFFVAKPVVSG